MCGGVNVRPRPTRNHANSSDSLDLTIYLCKAFDHICAKHLISCRRWPGRVVAFRAAVAVSTRALVRQYHPKAMVWASLRPRIDQVWHLSHFSRHYSISGANFGGSLARVQLWARVRAAAPLRRCAAASQ